MMAASTTTTQSSAEDCPQPAGRYIPVVNRNLCEGKEDCIAACPFDVFAMQRLSEAEKAAMPFLSRFKARLHGNRQAFAVRPNDCQACGQCIAACPEQAITLRQIGAQ